MTVPLPALYWAAAMAGLAALGALWAAYGWRSRRRVAGKRRRTVFCCANCGKVYLGGGVGGTDCPRCGHAPAAPGTERTERR